MFRLHNWKLLKAATRWIGLDWIGGRTGVFRCFCKGTDACPRQCTVVQSSRAVRCGDSKLYNQPASWSRVLLEKSLGSLLVKKQPASHVTRRFIAVFTTACHLSLSSARWIQCTPCHRTSLRTILILSSHWRLAFSLRFPYQNPTALCHSSVEPILWIPLWDTGLRGPVLSDPVCEAVGLCFNVLFEAKRRKTISTVRTVTRTWNLQNMSEVCKRYGLHDRAQLNRLRFMSCCDRPSLMWTLHELLHVHISALNMLDI